MGVQVTFKANPGAPNSYMGVTGENIIWRSGTWYLIDGLIGSVSTPQNGEYWMSESSAVNNPWYITANRSQSTGTVHGFFFDANHGWGGTYASSRTITFGSSFPLGTTSEYSTFPLLYNHSFIRYVVDNSDFRSRYSFQSAPAPVWQSASVSFDTISKTISWSIPSGNRQAIMQIFYSDSANGTFSKVQAFSPVALSGSWSVPSNGYYKVVFGSYPDGSVLQETPASSIFDLPSQYWTDAYGTIDSTNNTFSFTNPSSNPVAKVILWYRDTLSAGWSTVRSWIVSPATSILEQLLNSGYYRVTYSDPEDESNLYQVQELGWETIENSGEEPTYVSYYYYPETDFLYVQFSASTVKPDSVTLQYSSDGVSWVDLGTDTSMEGQPLINLPIGWYAGFEGVPGNAIYRVTVLPGNDTYTLGQFGGSSELPVLPDSDPSWIQSVVSWMQSFIGNLQPFFNGLTAWMPAEIRNAFWMLVLISLLIGFITIVRK